MSLIIEIIEIDKLKLYLSFEQPKCKPIIELSEYLDIIGDPDEPS
jgi:hypothetical protein